MKKCFSGLSWKRVAYVGGGVLITLAVIDLALNWRSSEFGTGVSANVEGRSVLAFLLVGMIVGMLGGIAMAFGYFIWREKRLIEEPDDLEQLLEELAREDADALYVEDSFESDDRGETLEPWERPNDWWKKGEDD